MKLGHDVTLFASGDSQTSAKLEPMWPRALRLDDTVRDPMALHIAMLEQRAPPRRRVRHPALPSRLLPVLGLLAPVHALHHHHARPARPAGASDGVQCVQLGAGHLDLRRPAPARAAGALAQDRPSRPAGRSAGRRARSSPPTSRSLAASRRRRRVDRAIRIAVRCGLPLKIAAKVDRVDRDYFEREIQPLLGAAGHRVHRRDRRRREVRRS